MSFELDSTNNDSNISEINSNTNILDSLKNSLNNYQEFFNELLNNSAFSEVNQSSSSDKEINQKYDKFSNEAYANLIVLVIKYKLIENTIISFFNKYSNYSISLLPKNIKQGKQFMNNI